MIPDGEYPKLLRALRISGSLLVLNSGWSAFSAVRKIPLIGELAENVVGAGRDNMRAELTFLLKWESPLTWAVLLGTAAALLILWLTRRLPGAVLTLGVSLISVT
jgi:hypothetical protein